MDVNRDACDVLADHFLAAARSCLALDATHSIAYVQCFYLYGTFVMNGINEIGRGDTFWPLLRTALGIAEAIGLHRDGSHWDLDPDTVTERRFVFWSLHHFDVVQSVGLGRGQCISDNRIDCVIPAVDYDTDYFPKSYELIRIVSQINDLQVRVRPATYAEVRRIDEKLWDFERSLPFHLSAAATPSAADLIDPVFKRGAVQRNQLQLYLNEARLALHRPWFVLALRQTPLEPANDPHKQSFSGCIEACRAIVHFVGNMVSIHGSFIQRRWHFFHHLFSACACLAACCIHAPSSSFARAALSELERACGSFKMGRPEILVSGQSFDPG